MEVRLGRARKATIGLLRRVLINLGLLGSLDGKESTCNEGDPSLIPGLRRSPREGNGNPLQYSCLENPSDRGACYSTVHGVAKSDTTERLNTHTH